MRDEFEIKLKRAYWNGRFDTLNTAENTKSDKFSKEWTTAQTWLTALDWILGQSDEVSNKAENPGNKT